MSKVYVVGGGHDYANLFLHEGYEVETDRFTDDVDLVCFTGGSDLSPSLYRSVKHSFCGTPNHRRDEMEVGIYTKAVDKRIPMVGICRGAQLLCAMAGGQLFQHVNNHHQAHTMTTFNGEEIVVTSSHHQMMDISTITSKHKPIVLGWATDDARSNIYFTGKGPADNPEKDLEVVYFPETNALAHQPHPEWMKAESPYYQFFFNSVHEYLGV